MGAMPKIIIFFGLIRSWSSNQIFFRPMNCREINFCMFCQTRRARLYEIEKILRAVNLFPRTFRLLYRIAKVAIICKDVLSCVCITEMRRSCLYDTCAANCDRVNVKVVIKAAFIRHNITTKPSKPLSSSSV